MKTLFYIFLDRLIDEKGHCFKADEFGSFFAYMSDSLHHALVRVSSNDLREKPLLSNEDHKVIGFVTIIDLVKLCDIEVKKIMKKRNQTNRSFGVNGSGIDNDEDHHIQIKRRKND